MENEPVILHSREPSEMYLMICFLLVFIGLMFFILIQRIEATQDHQTWVCNYMTQRIEINRDGEGITDTSVGFHQACPS